MKLLHLADLHLGKRVNGFDLLEDQRYILEQVLLLCDERGVQAVLLAGDLYDTAVPPAAAASLLSWFLTELASRGVAVLAIAGNHDSAERLDYAATLLARQNVHLAGRFCGAPGRVTLHDRFGPVEFTLLPFVRAATVRHYLPDAPITDYDSAVAAALAASPSNAPLRVLLAHQTVTGSGCAPVRSGSESAPLCIGTVENVDAARFAGFSYTALGHIHRPQRAGADTIRYAGSPLCYHLDECGSEKSAVLIDLGRKGVEDLQLLPLTPRRRMRHLTGPLAKLTAHPEDTQDYIWATLTDPTPLPDAMAVLRAAYPNTMRMEYLRTAGAVLPQPAEAARRRPFEELFDEFFEKQNDRPLTDAERDAVRAMREEDAP